MCKYTLSDIVDPMTKNARSRAATDLNKLRRMTPAEIRSGILADPDAHPTDTAFWKNAKVVMPAPKTIVTMRLDADLLRWFRQQRGYQTRINAILRAYMNAQA
ncbi:MAG: BrnA antitoxin family protein [Candidatus Sulfotelmatobacter sp.]